MECNQSVGSNKHIVDTLDSWVNKTMDTEKNRGCNCPGWLRDIPWIETNISIFVSTKNSNGCMCTYNHEKYLFLPFNLFLTEKLTTAGAKLYLTLGKQWGGTTWLTDRDNKIWPDADPGGIQLVLSEKELYSSHMFTAVPLVSSHDLFSVHCIFSGPYWNE